MTGIAASYDVATGEVGTLLNTKWQAGSAAIGGIGYIPTLILPDAEPNTAQDKTKHFARLSFKTAASAQTSLSASVQGTDLRRFTTTGSLFVQVFGPMVIATGQKNARLLAQFVQQLLRARPGPADVKLMNVRIQEQLPAKDFYCYNVVSDFTYDEIG